MKRSKKKKAFTFVEIIISIAIVAILIAVAIPAYKAIKMSAERTAHNANVDQISSVALLYFNDNPGVDNVTSTKLHELGYLKNDVKVPSSISSKDSIYHVTIDSNGFIIVSPDKVKSKKDTNPANRETDPKNTNPGN